MTWEGLRWSRVIDHAVYRRGYAGEALGISREELKSIGWEAALKAERDWDPEAGRSLDSWVYLNVEYDLTTALDWAARHPTALWDPDESPAPQPSLDSAAGVRRAVALLRAQVSAEHWQVLSADAQGYTSDEIAAQLRISPMAVRHRLSKARIFSGTIFRGAQIDTVGDIL